MLYGVRCNHRLYAEGSMYMTKLATLILTQ
jgi:hypothetical protein